MKKILLLYFVFLLPTTALPQVKEPTQYTVGTGFNIMGLIFRGDRTQTKSSPLFNAGADYFLGNHISVGPVFSFQRISVTDTSSGIPPGQVPFISLNRISPGARALLWHETDFGTGSNVRFHLFLGFRFSYDRIELSKSNIILSSGYSKTDFTYQRFTRQLQLGGRIKIKNRWGAFGEFALGAPYFFQLGIFVQ